MAPTGLAPAARRVAQQILSRPPYRESPSRDVLEPLLHRIGQWLSDVFVPPWHWIYRHIAVHVSRGLHVAFGRWWPIPLGSAVLVAAALTGWVLARRRARVASAPPTAAPHTGEEDPRLLERQAESAEERGEYADAVRLWFRAGLVRLEQRGMITAGRTSTDGQLAATLGSPTFERLARRVEVIVFAGRPATSDDAASARTAWPQVSAEADTARKLRSTPAAAAADALAGR